MKPALQIVIAINPYIQSVVDYVQQKDNVSLIQFGSDDKHVRIIYDATEEQQEGLDSVLNDMMEKLNSGGGSKVP